MTFMSLNKKKMKARPFYMFVGFSEFLIGSPKILTPYYLRILLYKPLAQEKILSVF